ncbi:MAG: 50S ribosomal protein L13 [Candidatus Marinimicrobia bacterium]|jgi:large subunit ribosomal protein L13|nr:50S ribosomal protein L13 [Candidatus Neomarinimicrobiota bacterium]MBT3618673.1 50S ribosomal protein L13 [Candidatus Neomarinimicrobiota bacterium]MBT3828576.1 50S ribosomal protein L13 [Candidatus Neomarinimicrobiota bacterium]MBT3997019.1 50S ribosomal protein L13 [Candidatus Neomarinimicrobiota bacterium]MBT4281221.1 50S ribosomal protein L13 [Candidatus Neomarinimicrobiota bacterium]
MKTKTLKAHEITRDWYIADAAGKMLGRFSSEVAQILRGKHKPTFSPHLDMGDFVVVINAEKIKVSGNKETKKEYFKHSGYPGGTTFTDFQHMMKTHPDRIITGAIKGMLPKNRLGRKLMSHLKVYAGDEHPHIAQNPKTLEI